MVELFHRRPFRCWLVDCVVIITLSTTIRRARDTFGGWPRSSLSSRAVWGIYLFDDRGKMCVLASTVIVIRCSRWWWSACWFGPHGDMDWLILSRTKLVFKRCSTAEEDHPVGEDPVMSAIAWTGSQNSKVCPHREERQFWQRKSECA